MLNVKELFKERISAHVRLLNRYLRYIFNGHFMIAILFLIVTAAVYYQRWLSDVPETFPAALVIALLFTFVVLYNPLQLFLTRPDQVFLIVQEKALQQYYIYALLYNYVMQLYLVFIVIASLGPLYFAFYPERDTLFNVMIVAVVLLIKAWNLTLHWRMLQRKYHPAQYVERAFRAVLTFFFFYTLLTHEYFLWMGIVYVIYLNGVYFFYIQEKRMNWERLIKNDETRLAKFYQFVSLFAEVPQVDTRIRKRRFLANIVHRQIPFRQSYTFAYLYRLTFLRSGDYFSLYVRLTILAIVVIIFVPNPLLKVALALLFLYMTSFQLQTLFYHHRMNVWLDLYPLQEEGKREAFLSFAIRLSQIQVVLLSLVFLFLQQWLLFVAMLVLGLIFTFTFHYFYVKGKLAERG